MCIYKCFSMLYTCMNLYIGSVKCAYTNVFPCLYTCMNLYIGSVKCAYTNIFSMCIYMYESIYRIG